MKINEAKNININDLIMLLQVKDNFRDFMWRLGALINTYDLDYLDLLNLIQSGKKIRNKDVREFITRYFIKSNMYELLEFLSKITCERQTLMYIVQDYFLENEDKTNLIMANLQKIKELGINDVYIDFSCDFTEQLFEYTFPINQQHSYKINQPKYFLENMDVAVTFPISDKIYYKTTNSSYCIELRGPIHIDDVEDDTKKLEGKIILNSLIFDTNSLPKNLTKKYTVKVIKEIVENKLDKLKHLQNALEYTMYVAIFEEIEKKINSIIMKTEDLKNNSSLINIDIYLQEQIDRLLTSCGTYLDNSAENFGIEDKSQASLVSKTVSQSVLKLKQILEINK